MRITSVSLLSNDTEAVRFDLRNVASKSPYMIRHILGLDPDELIPKFYGFSRDGKKKFYDFNLKPRFIVMRIVLNPRFKLDEDHSTIRDELYRTISRTRTGLVTLQFHAGAATVAHVSGFITKFEVPHFSKTPEIQMTVKCDDPVFRGLNPTIMGPANLPNVNTVVVADSQSTAPHGFKMDVTLTAAIPNFTIQDRAVDPEWFFKIIPNGGFLVGDILHFSSEFREKFLYLDRGGVIIHLMDKVDLTSVWPILFPGFNEFHFNDIASFDWEFIRYDTTYWGV